MILVFYCVMVMADINYGPPIHSHEVRDVGFDEIVPIFVGELEDDDSETPSAAAGEVKGGTGTSSNQEDNDLHDTDDSDIDDTSVR